MFEIKLTRIINILVKTKIVMCFNGLFRFRELVKISKMSSIVYCSTYINNAYIHAHNTTMKYRKLKISCIRTYIQIWRIIYDFYENISYTYIRINAFIF